MGNCPEDPDEYCPTSQRKEVTPTDEFAGQFHKGLQIGFIDGLRGRKHVLS